MVTDDKFLLLKLHPCSEGLRDDALREISERCELLRCDSGHVLHRASDAIDSIYLVIQGSIKQSLIDIHGNVLMERYQVAGTQVGALAAASGEPSPLQVEVMEPTTLLRLSYQTFFELTKQYDVFRRNLSRMVAEAIQSTLMGERRKKLTRILSIFHQSPATRLISRRLLERFLDMGMKPFVISDQPDWAPIDGIPHYCAVQNGRYVPERELRQLIGESPEKSPVVIDIDAGSEIEKVTNLVEASEKVLWCVTPENWRDGIERLKDIQRHTPSWRNKISTVWLLPDEGSWAPPAPELRALSNRDFKVSVGDPKGGRNSIPSSGLERLLHEIRGVKIGLALGGGAARGMAHFGVLNALEKNGICIDMIVGTSAGAMTGILYASGMKPEYGVESFLTDLRPPWLFRQLPNGGYWHLLYRYRRGHFDPMLRRYLKESRLEQLPIPVCSVTVDLISGQTIVREEGDSVHAIIESINLPVLSSPINRDGRALVDGGIINNVPADVLVSKGCNFVIAVSVTAQMIPEFASNRPDTPTSRMRSASTLQTVMRTYIVQNVNLNSVGVQPADFVIEPNVSEFDLTEFLRADEMAAIGEKATVESIPKLKQLLSRVDDKLFAVN